MEFGEDGERAVERVAGVLSGDAGWRRYIVEKVVEAFDSIGWALITYEEVREKHPPKAGELCPCVSPEDTK